MIQILNTSPAGFPITLDQVKEFAFINTDAYDSAITANIPAAVEYLESYLGKKFVNQTYDLFYDLPEFSNVMSLALNVNSITQVSTFDDDDAETVIDSTNYRLFNNKLIFNDYQPFTSVSSIRYQQSVKVTVEVGFGADSTDQEADVQSALSQLIAYWAKGGSIASTDGREQEVLLGIKSKVQKHFNRTVWL